MHSKRRRIILTKTVAYILLSLFSVIFLFPFFWMLSSALKPDYEIFLFPPKWIPKPILWSNFSKALTSLPFGIYFKNTLIIVIFTILGKILSCTIVAYGFARLKAPGKDVLFVVLLSTMMLPYSVTMIPVFYIFKSLGWVNTLLPLIVPSFFGDAFYIFLLRQFILTIPTDFEESAKIDGASTLQIMWNIMIPLLSPALATVAIFTFLGSWNDFLGPLIYLNDQRLYTLALGLNFFRGQYDVKWNYLMAASVVVMMPCLLVFFFFQRYFIEGITLTGMKG